MASNNLQRHENSDRIKWFVTAVVGVLLVAAVTALTAGLFGAFRGMNERTYRFEAEEAALAGGTQVTEVDGVACVGEFINNNTTPHTVTFTVYAEADTTADLLICLTADSVDRNLSDLAGITVNGVTVNVPYKVVRYADPRTWADWREIDVCEIQLNEGENTLVFTGGYPGANFDYIELTADKSVELSAEPFEAEQPAEEETGSSEAA